MKTIKANSPDSRSVLKQGTQRNIRRLGTSTKITASQRRRLLSLGPEPWIEDRRWKRAKPSFLIGSTEFGLRLVSGRGETLEEALNDAGQAQKKKARR